MNQLRSKTAMACALILLLGITNGALGIGGSLKSAPSNDNCANAKAVGDVSNLAFDTTQATIDGSGYYINSPNVWYCYTASCTGCATVSLAGSSFDTRVAVYNGCSCYPAAIDMIIKNDDFNGYQSQVTFAVTAGRQYLIEIGGFNASVKGPGVISISCNNQASAPSNNNCSNAKSVGNVTELAFDTRCATFDGSGHCTPGPNLWYLYRANRTGDITVTLEGIDGFDTKLAVYRGSDCYPRSSDMIECNDDFGDTLDSQVTFAATSGRYYLIEVGGYNEDAVGRGLMTIAPEGLPPSDNDDCVDAQAVSDVKNLAFDTTDATFDGPGLCMTSPNIWYCYTASCNGDVTVSLLGSDFDTKLAVYNRCSCNPTSSRLTECNDDFPPGYQSQITFEATAGSKYLIEVGGYGSTTGQGILNISCEGSGPPPSKDDCENAQSIGEVKDLAFDTTGRTFDGPGLCMTSPNIWYVYTPTCTGDATVSLLGSSFDTMLAVYEGGDCDLSSNDMIECNDDASGGVYQSEITFAATVGTKYLIEIGGYGSNTGQGILNISCEGGAVTNAPDLGDAPDSTNNFNRNMNAYPAPSAVKANYPTVYNDGSGTGPFGPVHLNGQVAAYLGKKITSETEADKGADEDSTNNIIPSSGLSNNDKGDDGVVFPLNLPACRWSTFDYTVNVVDPSIDLWVNVWFDWNRDGDWDDTLDCAQSPAPEWAVRNQLLFNLPVGLNQITTPAFLPWHPVNGRKRIWMRITLSEQPYKHGSNPGVKGNAGSGPQGKYLYGETEDYFFTPSTSYTICEDFNGDGVVDTDDLVTFTSEWLENCPD